MSEYKLIEEILSRSSSKIWNDAKKEWILTDIEFADSDICLCGHNPIVEVCFLENEITQERVKVGNCCVKKFIGLPSDKIFNGIKKIKCDIEDSTNNDTISYAYNKGWINKWEFDFYSNIYRKRKLTPKQYNKKIMINETILSSLKNNKKV